MAKKKEGGNGRPLVKRENSTKNKARWRQLGEDKKKKKRRIQVAEQLSGRIEARSRGKRKLKGTPGSGYASLATGGPSRGETHQRKLRGGSGEEKNGLHGQKFSTPPEKVKISEVVSNFLRGDCTGRRLEKKKERDGAPKKSEDKKKPWLKNGLQKSPATKN